MKQSTPGGLLLRDVPADLEVEADAFGHDDYARALASLLDDVTAPFTVGLFGPWGQGKSTVLERLKHHVPDDVVVTSFDAWRHEGHALRRHFLKALADDLSTAKVLPSDYKRHRLRLLDADVALARPSVAISVGRLARALVPAVLVAGAVLAVVSVATQKDFADTLRAAPWAVLGSVIALGGFLTTLMSQVLADAQETTTLKRLDEPDRFTDEFELMLGAVDARRVFVVIDNLDRCSPERALETLSTVKTYLEPAVQKAHEQKSWLPWKADRPPTDAVFVVAVDDAALRRHLVAKELSDSALARGESGAASQQDHFSRHAASGYITEYLRKFFGLTFTVHDLLDDDMRDYTHEQLAPVLAYWRRPSSLAEDETSRAADFITFTLGRNPRLIKQFINSFSARLQLIAERERGTVDRPARLSPPISPYVHTVLMLALMEERWPEHHRLLRESPQALMSWYSWAEWQADLGKVVEGVREAGDNPEDEDFRVLERDDWALFSEFLRRSERPSAEINLRPFFTLKQTQLEVRLPDFARLRTAIRSARWAEADEIIDNAGPLGADYVNQLGRTLEDERSHGYAGSAAAYVRALLKMPATLGKYPDEVSRVLGASYRAGGRLADELFANGPDVLGCLSWMREDDTRTVMGLVVTKVLYSDPAVRRHWVRVLAREFDGLPQDARDMLKKVASDEWPSMNRIGPLFDAIPELVPDYAISDIVERLNEYVAAMPQPPSASDYMQRQQWVESVVMELGRLQRWTAGHTPDEQTAERIAIVVAALLPGGVGSQDHLQALLKASADGVGNDFHPTPDGANALSEALDAAWIIADADRQPLVTALGERAVLTARPHLTAHKAHWRRS